MTQTQYHSEQMAKMDFSKILTVIGFAMLVLIFFGAVSFLGNTTANAESIEKQLSTITAECRGIGARAIRYEIVTKAKTLKMDDVDAVLEPIRDLNPVECKKMNDQLDAASD